MEALAKEQREHTKILVDQHKEKDQVVQLELHRRLLAYEQKQAKIDKEKQELEATNKKLQQDLEAQTSKIDGMREYISHRLKSVQDDEEEHIKELRENFAVELDTKINTATTELREMLEMRDVELFYRHQTEAVLKEEIASLKKDNQVLVGKSAQFMLDRFAKSGVSMAVNLLGLGNVNIPRDDIERFLDDPQAYAAERAGVNYPVYMAWLDHQQNPCCNSVDPGGRRCGKTITLVTTPAEFRSGESDKCEQHRISPLSLVVTRR
jgi:DNA-binding transcriptional regulator YiaG